jgi:predicted kinase
MKYQVDEINEIAAKFADFDSGGQRDLILLAGLPGVGKTTLAREFARQTGGLHFDIDEVKREVVPKDAVAESIDPPEMRFKYYAETIRKLPDLFSESPSQTVVIDETFHMKDFRELWGEVAKEMNIRVHWIEVVCDEECVKERLTIGKDRENHVLGDKAYPMYCLFKEFFEPMDESCVAVDTTKDIAYQVQRIIKERSIGTIMIP